MTYPAAGYVAYDQPFYRGYQLWLKMPNWSGELTTPIDRMAIIRGGPTGQRGERSRGAAARRQREYSWLLTDRTEIDRLHHFVFERRGRLVPVWIPSWAPDLALAMDVSAVDTTIIIREAGYAALQLGLEARRHLTFLTPGQPAVVRRVSAAVDNGDGTETLTLESATGAAWPAAHTLVSFLLLMRVASDTVTFAFHSRTVATVAVPMVEVPEEIAA